MLRNKFRVSRVQNWGVMSSLKMVFACARNLIVHRFRWYQSFTVLSHLLGTDWCELARRFLN